MYAVLLVHRSGDGRVDPLYNMMQAEERRIGLPIAIGDWNDLTRVPERSTAVVYLGSTEAASDARCQGQVNTALALDLPIIPVVEREPARRQQVPERLQYLKTITWSDGERVPRELPTTILEVLGITDRERRVFISYRQSDAAPVAIQLCHALSERRFRVFLDQFETSPAENVQDRIAEALESMACVLLLQSPEVHVSEWVDREITQALKSQLPVLVLRWSNTVVEIPKVEGAGLPRFILDVPNDLMTGKIRPDRLVEILDWVERYHADGLLRRRQESVRAARLLAEARGWTSIVDTRWKLLLTKPSGGLRPVLLGITPRLSRPEDLYELDLWPVPALPVIGIQWRKVVMQASTELPEKRRAILEWVAEARDMGVSPGVNALEYFL